MVSGNLLFLYVVAMEDSGDSPNSFDEAALSVAEVNGQLPGPGLEIETVLDFKISWVREALAAVGITVGDLSHKAECKAALIKYYRDLNTAASKAETTKVRDLNTAASEVGAAKAPKVIVSFAEKKRPPALG